MTDAGRADLHIHTLASDGTAGVAEILDHVERATDLDVIAITDHERIDAARRRAGDGPRPRAARSRSSSARRSRRAAATCSALFIDRADPAVPLAALDDRRIHDQGGLAIPAHPLVPYPLCAQGCDPPPPARRSRPALPPRRARGVQPDDARPAVARTGSSGSPTEHGLARVGNSDAHAPSAIGTRLDHVPGHDAARPAARRSRPGTTRPRRDLPRDARASSATFRRQLRKYGRDARDEVRGRVPATAPGATSAIPAAGSVRRGSTTRGSTAEAGSAMKIGLVARTSTRCRAASTQHVRVPVREPPAARPRRADHHREPRPAARVRGRRHPARQRLLACPTNGSVGTLTFSPRYIGQVQRDARARAVRPAPLPRAVRAVPVARPAARIARASTSRPSTPTPASRRRTSSAAGSCAATPRGSTAGSRSAPRRATSSTATSRATTRSSPTASTSPRFPSAVPIARWQDGTLNILFVGRLEPRKGLLDLLKAYRILRKTGCDCRLLVVGAGPQEREARRYVATRGCRASSSSAGSATRRRRSSSRRPTSTSRRPPAASRSGSSCSRRWPPGTPIVCCDIHGYKGVVRRGREGLLVPPREPEGARRARSRTLLDDDAAAGRDGRRRPARAEEFSWQRVTAKVEDVLRLRDPPPRRRRIGAQLPADFRVADRLRRPPAPGQAARLLAPDVPRGPCVRRPASSATREPPGPGRVGHHEAGHDQAEHAGPPASA